MRIGIALVDDEDLIDSEVGAAGKVAKSEDLSSEQVHTRLSVYGNDTVKGAYELGQALYQLAYDWTDDLDAKGNSVLGYASALMGFLVLSVPAFFKTPPAMAIRLVIFGAVALDMLALIFAWATVIARKWYWTSDLTWFPEADKLNQKDCSGAPPPTIYVRTASTTQRIP